MAIHGEAKKPDGGPAFPGRQDTGKLGEFRSSSGGPGVSFPITEDMPGMTLRDYFAGQALGIMNTALDQGYWSPGENPNAEIAAAAYQIADAMLAERER